ncbi:hypothetical protein BN8_p06747 (plasmid) [Fibrisoma limi BUZ 3]|uniref:Uncharacterized protein n=1 Tax=Fibrisoma limi BUZ 3 TaxID=1185876 RepID=I2GTW0_9BACT|nr:hypothetical protein [Fibrisoma limi]CCH57561.1 hypothetical protein BN8_p06747 [Fibrisoma limi BUZ 3]
MKLPIKPIPLDQILHFIYSYRQLEKLPLEDGFAELRAITPKVLGDNERELKELRQHFRNQWYDKERSFGQFYLNLAHYRQVYLLNFWGIQDWQDEEYLGTCLRNPFVRIAGRPPAKAFQLHQLVKYMENHGISSPLTDGVMLTNLPEMEKRFGNSANWGDYVLSIPDPEPILRYMIGYEPEAGYDFDPEILQ